MTEAEIHANYEQAIGRQLEELVAIIVQHEGEIERLRAERDALRQQVYNLLLRMESGIGPPEPE
jgi:cell division protein FtsB